MVFLQNRLRTVRRTFFAALLCGLLWALGRPALAEPAEIQAALDLVPADAPIVFVVPNLAQLSRKIAALGQKLGVTSPEMANMLGKLKEQRGFKAGLKDDGALVMYITSADFVTQPGDDQLVLLVPVTDYDQFLTNVQSATTTDDITLGRLGTESMYVKKLPGYAAISQGKEGLAGYAPGRHAAAWTQAVGQPGAKYLPTADFLILCDVARLAPTLQPKLKKGLESATAMMEIAQSQNPNADPAALGLAKTMFHAYVATALARDTTTAMLAVDLNDAGVGLTLAAQFRPDSHLGKVFTTGASAGPLLTKLHDQPYLIASACNTTGIDMQSLLTDLENVLSSSGQESWAATIKPLLPAYQNVRGVAQAFYVPTQPTMGGALLATVSVIDTTDPAGLIHAYQSYLAALGDLKFAAPAASGPAAPPATGPAAMPPATQPAAPAGMTFTSEYKPAALHIEGLTVDQFSWQMILPPEMMQNNPALPLLMLLGATGQTGYITQTNGHVIITTSPDVALLTTAIKDVRDNQPGLGTAKLIQEARTQNLPPDACIEGYINVTGVAGLANNFLVMFGMPALPTPAELPPITMGVALQDSAVTGRLYVPTAVLTFIKSSAQQITAPRSGHHATTAPETPGTAPGMEPQTPAKPGPKPAPR